MRGLSTYWRCIPMTKVDVVILNYNSGNVLEKCINNLKNTNYPINIIVVDNGSKDKSTDFLKNHSDITLIKNHKNIGCPAGLNKAYPHLKGDYIAYLNEDIFPESYWLDRIIPLFEMDKQLGAVGMKLIGSDGSIKVDGSFIDPLTCEAGIVNAQFSEPTYVPYTGLGNIVIRKVIFKKVGLFEEMFFLYWEDVEFCIRLWRAGYTVKFVPSVKAIHLEGWAIRNTPKVKIKCYNIRNGILTTFAYLNFDEIKIYLPSITLLKIILIGCLIKNRDKVNFTAHFLAIIGVVRRLNWIIRKRIENKYNNIPLTQISNILSINPTYYKTEHSITKNIRKKVRARTSRLIERAQKVIL